jgi:SPP1 family predicted phage head-tail adaptor
VAVAVKRQPYYIGELTERINLIRHVETIDAYGTVNLAPSTIEAGVPAHVRPMSGRERDRGQQTEAQANYLVVMRAREDLTEKDAIYWRGKLFDIAFIRDRGPRAVFLEIEAIASTLLDVEGALAAAEAGNDSAVMS